MSEIHNVTMKSYRCKHLLVCRGLFIKLSCDVQIGFCSSDDGGCICYNWDTYHRSPPSFLLSQSLSLFPAVLVIFISLSSRKSCEANFQAHSSTTVFDLLIVRQRMDWDRKQSMRSYNHVKSKMNLKYLCNYNLCQKESRL